MGVVGKGLLGRAWSVLGALALGAMLAPAALAEEAEDWQIGMQPGVTPVRARMDFLHQDILLPIITIIAVFVLVLLLYVIVRFNAKRHPVPSQTSHNTVIELLWTAVPALVLLVIFVPSIELLYYTDRTPKADLTLKVTGHQWYWSYEYPDQGLTEEKGKAIDSNIVPEDKLKPGEPRLLTVDNPVVVPVGATVRILVTGSDVIHSWFVPAAGVQEYAVIGRENESWMRIDQPGVYYGQCNQICGLNHPFMPIEIHAVPQPRFNSWVSCLKLPKAGQPRGGCIRYATAEDGPAPAAVSIAAATSR